MDPLLEYGQQLVEIPCPEVPGVQLFAKRATLEERLAYTAGGADGGADIADILALTLRNADGSLRFKSRDDALKLDSRFAQTLVERILKANNLTPQADEAAEKK